MPGGGLRCGREVKGGGEPVVRHARPDPSAGACCDVSVQRTRPEDADEVSVLCREAVRAIEGRRGADQLLSGSRRDLAERLSSPAGVRELLGEGGRIVVSGFYAGVVAGFAVGSIDPEATPRRGILHGVYVAAGLRELGTGGALLETMLQVFRDAECQSVEAYCLPGDRATKRLLEAAGMTARLLTVATAL